MKTLAELYRPQEGRRRLIGGVVMSRTHTELYLHLVFATKLRLPLIGADLRQELHPYLGGVVRNHGGIPLAIGGMPDHVHLLIRAGTWISLPTLMKSMKGSSAKWVNEGGKHQGHFGWQEGYAVFSVSPSIVGKVRRYIENQEHHHRTMSSQEELKWLIQKNDINATPSQK